MPKNCPICGNDCWTQAELAEHRKHREADKSVAAYHGTGGFRPTCTGGARKCYKYYKRVGGCGAINEGCLYGKCGFLQLKELPKDMFLLDKDQLRELELLHLQLNNPHGKDDILPGPDMT